MIEYLLPLVLFVGCSGNGELPGEYFEIKATAGEDDCGAAEGNWKDKFDYRMVVDGNTVELAVGPDVFATGRMEGCLVVYETVIWEEQRNGGEIAWQILGTATVSFDPGACPPLVENEDWVGSEEFLIVSADDGTGLTPGCGFSTSLVGKHLKGVK